MTVTNETMEERAAVKKVISDHLAETGEVAWEGTISIEEHDIVLTDIHGHTIHLKR